MCWCKKKSRVLILTSICSCASFACLCIAVATDYWLYATERVLHSNGTFMYKNTTTGLWRKCVEDERFTPKYRCEYIDYFVYVDREGLGPTESILLSLRRFTLFPMISLVILLVGESLCLSSHIHHIRRNVLTLVSGIMFVVGGLFVLVGIVIYIGAITEEVGNTRPGMDELPKFVYSYGCSFILIILSFVGSEVTGVLSVYLYISQYQLAYHKEQDRIAINVDTNHDVSSRSRPVVTGNNSHGGYSYTAVSANCNDTAKVICNNANNCHAPVTGSSFGGMPLHFVGYSATGCRDNAPVFGYRDTSVISGYRDSAVLSGYRDATVVTGYRDAGTVVSGYRDAGSVVSGYRNSGGTMDKTRSMQELRMQNLRPVTPIYRDDGAMLYSRTTPV